MNGALLSRFDLVFILLDRPDEEMDCLLSEHVMALHEKKGRSQEADRDPAPGGGGVLRATARRTREVWLLASKWACLNPLFKPEMAPESLCLTNAGFLLLNVLQSFKWPHFPCIL